jgi:chemotaxis protein CheZ
MAGTAKRYRIEESFRTDAVTSHPSSVDPVTGEHLSQILATVLQLKSFLDPAQRMATDVVDAYRREIAEVYQLRNELDAMKDAINSTKLEIASLHRSDHEGKGMRRVAGELDAVVEATEEATTAILGAIEDIETQANMMRSAGVQTGNNDCVGAILERVIVMYEACNFQDLTGQRISKIVTVLKFVEERLDRMIGVWGGLDAFKEFAEQAALASDPDASLLNGPKLKQDLGHVDQIDIDALFD